MTASVRILVTGFEPFGGSPLNPSREVLPRLASASLPGVELRTALLPVVGGDGSNAAPAALADAIRRDQPHIVLCVGETGSRGSICVERRAVNRRHYRIPDNAGAVVHDAPVVVGGPVELRATLPIPILIDAMARTGAPVEPSDDAGAFLCNEVMYHALQLAPRHDISAAGFIHVPRLPEQVGPGSDRPSLALDRTTAALAAAIVALRDWCAAARASS